MLIGVVSPMLVLVVSPLSALGVNVIYAFTFIVRFSAIQCFVGSLMTESGD
jgi:hypothetical protein